MESSVAEQPDLGAAYRLIPLAQLLESPLNPRKHFDSKSLEELAASIRQSGIITPLIVRPNAKDYEIGAGHRRYRAAKLAGLEVAPVIVRELDDAAFVELLNIENLQRQDMTALEEAEGYRLLMTKARYTVERIAERVGMSVKYVYDRVKLLELTEPARKALREDTITAGHAILLARLTPKQQALVMDADKGGLWEPEYSLEDPDSTTGRMRDVKARSVKELDAWIAEHIRFDAEAPDPMLFPETVATLKAVTEQAETVVKITHELYIQDTARDPKERTITPRSWTRADGTKGSKTCDYAVTGVVVVGPGRGDAFKVCINKDKCDRHWGAEKRERAKRAARGQVGGGGPKLEARWEVEQRKRLAEEAKRDAEVARWKNWKKARPQLLEALAVAVKKASSRANGLLGGLVLETASMEWEAKGIDTARYVPRGTTAEDLVRHVAFRLLVNDLCEYAAPDDFPKRAKAFGLDVRKIVDEVAPKPAPETVQTTATKKTPAAKKTAKRKKGGTQ